MFTAEIRVNGSLVAHLYGRNVEVLSDGQCEYDYEYYEVDHPGQLLKIGSVAHDQEDGIAALVSKILAHQNKLKTK